MIDPAVKRRVWGWMAFDWASQPYYTLLLTFIFGPYFVAIATRMFMGDGLTEDLADAQAQSVWSLGQTVAGLLIALSAPFLGAFADTTGRRMPWIVVFSLFYVVGAAGLWWMVPDGSFLWGGLICFAIGLIGAEFTTIFTNSMLPDLGNESQVGEISGSGFAIGYCGGVLALFTMLLLFAESEAGVTLLGIPPLFGLDPDLREGTRFVGPFVAAWYALFMVIFFVWVREPRQIRRKVTTGDVLSELGQSLRSVLRNRSLASYLVSSMLYRDALNALYGFGGTYATLVLNWSITQVGIFGIVGAITAAVFSWLGGKLDARIGPKPVIILFILILTSVCVIIVFMSRASFFGMPLAAGSALPDIVFYICGAVIGAAGGGLQSSSRSMMVRHANPARPTEAFGLYALSGKATAFLGPFLIGTVTYLTGSARLGISPLIVLFLLGLVLLVWVKAEGIRKVQ